jgi:curli biogenesis system outer membrane secretion channel CsgG
MRPSGTESAETEGAMKRRLMNLVAAAVVVAGGAHLTRAQANAAAAAPAPYFWCEGPSGTSNCYCRSSTGITCWGTACEAGYDYCNWWVY